MVFTFGSNGFFGYGRSSPTDTMWWSTCEAENLPAETQISISDMREQLKTRHQKWKDPVLHAIIETAEVDSIYPVWQTPELPHWGKGGCVLVGDAAHALNPTSGQGSSQALEDTKTLAILLERFVKESTESDDGSTSENKLAVGEVLDRTIKALYEVRNPRVDKIVQRTKMLSNRKKEQGLVEEMMTCFFFWLIGIVPAVGKLLDPFRKDSHNINWSNTLVIGKLAVGDVVTELYHWDVYAEIDKAVARLGWEGKGK
jgi:2-polyprenyl-6-methoxyphenol hydroxylase-like FAD-dependent oxidoreductase